MRRMNDKRKGTKIKRRTGTSLAPNMVSLENVDPPVGSRLTKKLAIWGILGALGAALIGVLGTMAWDAYKAKPKLQGTILSSSVGRVEEQAGLTSIVLFVQLQALTDVPTTPNDFRLRIRTRSGWLEAALYRPPDQSGILEMWFAASAPQPIMLGDWTGCFPGSAQLMTANHVPESIVRDKPISGILRFILRDVTDLEVAQRTEMELTLVAANQR